MLQAASDEKAEEEAKIKAEEEEAKAKAEEDAAKEAEEEAKAKAEEEKAAAEAAAKAEDERKAQEAAEAAKPGEPTEGGQVTLDIRLLGQLEDVAGKPDSAKRKTFVKRFIVDMAKQLGVDESRIEVEQITLDEA